MKLQLFQSHLKKNKIDLAILVYPDPTITYFTQLKPSAAYLTITPKTTELYLSKLDVHPRIPKVVVRLLTKDWWRKHRSKKIITIGINKPFLTVAQLEKIQKIWPEAEFVDVSLMLDNLRATKTQEEIKRITKACDITTKAFYSLVKELPRRKLKTEQDVALFLEKEIKKQGAELAFPTIVANGKNAAIPHHLTSTQKLKAGFLLLDFGACYQNYCADMTRMIFLGKPTKKEKHYYDLLLNAQLKSIAHSQPAMAFEELDKMARKNLGKYSKNFTHSLGHGIGVEVHESPVFSDREQVICEDNIFTIEPGIYLPGKFGLRIEDTVLYSGKAVVLTKATKELQIISF
jgi:Xaa-Pro aminopeptidase